MVAVVAAAAAAQQPRDFGPVAAVVQRHCGDCHDGDARKGGLDLAALPRSGDAVHWFVALRRLRARVLAGEMPPPTAPAMPGEARQQLLQWLGSAIRQGVPQLPRDPGRVTIRRLSRSEWEHCVHDLFGGRSELAAAFPADDLGYGFDNIGDALSFSTLHLEHYLAAAADVAAQVIDLDDPARPTVRRFEAEAMTVVGRQASVVQDGDIAHLLSAATIEQEFVLPRDGSYRLEVVVGGDLGGDEPPKLVLRLDGRDVDSIEVPQRQLQVERWTLPLAGGTHRLGLRFPNDFYQPDNPDPQQRDRNLRIDCCEVIGPLDRREQPAARWLLDADPGRGTAAARARAVARILLPRLWRRPVSDGEVARLAGLCSAAVAAGESFAAGERLLLQAALTSPNFLFRGEPGGLGGDGAAALPDVALASRLSFFLWCSTPDPELMQLATRGELHRPGVLQRQLDRMLADARADALATDFASQWLELRALWERTPDPGLFPGFDDALRRSMARETELLFRSVLRENRDVRELLDCDFTFVDAALAAFYGIDSVAGDGFVRVQLPAAMRLRGGLLGQASVLAVTSNPTRTSPVKRGKWILQNLLGQAPPPPPPGNSNLPNEAAIDSAATLRLQLAQHRARESCASCHRRMDPLGLALEHFDAIGRHRTMDAGGPIDATGELPDGRTLDGLADLKAALQQDPAFTRTLLEKLFVYGVGRDASDLDRLRLDLVADELLARGKVTLPDLIQAVVQSDAFLQRREAR